MPASVMACIPTGDGLIHPMCGESVGNAIDLAWRNGLLDRVVHHYPHDYGIEMARDEAARAALGEKVDFIWMVDSDVIVPPDALSNLLSPPFDVDMVCGWYVRGSSDDGTTNAIRLGTRDFWESYKADEFEGSTEQLVEVKGNGLGCALVRTGVFERVPQPWFRFVRHPDGSKFGEDYWFAQQCANARVRIYVDTRVHCGHIHERVL